MDAETFWKLNEGLPPETAEQSLRERLASLDVEDVAGYQRRFDLAFVDAYRWDLWGAAYLIDGGCSDDGFMDFRFGLISRGRSLFERSIADPDSLADVADRTDDGFIPNPDFGYVAHLVYESKTGKPMPATGVKFLSDAKGERWDFDDAAMCHQKLPRLWAKFGS